MTILIIPYKILSGRLGNLVRDIKIEVVKDTNGNQTQGE